MTPPPRPPAGTPDVVFVFGRDPSCDVAIEHPTVSTRHARLLITTKGLVVEDLGSTNGTFVAGQRVRRARIERGDDVRFGSVHLPWSDPRVGGFLRKALPSGTLVMSDVAAVMANGARRPAASPPPPPASTARRLLGLVGGVAFGLVVVGAGWYVAQRAPERTARLPAGIREMLDEDAGPPAQVGPLGRERIDALAHAIDSTNAVTRNTAVKIAAGEEGPFHVEQVARIWTHVRGRWRYVNDPRGAEYFANASETITNEYVGDCDDFAIVLAAMINSIGGEVRVVVMNEGAEGHAYAEACIRMDPAEVSTRLATYYRRKWDPYLGRQRVERIHFRTSAECPLWLNLDWSAGVPGGPYANETWAVSVAEDASAEELTPAVADSVPDAGATSTRTRRTSRTAQASGGQ